MKIQQLLFKTQSTKKIWLSGAKLKKAQRKATKLIDKTSETSGSMCKFHLITPNIGIKIYRRIEWAQDSQITQRLAFKHKLAPQVLSKVFRVTKDGCDYYCFFTAVAKVFRTYDEYASCEKTGESSIRNLKSKLREIGLDFAASDLHYRNVGIYRGKLICVDTGE